MKKYHSLIGGIALNNFKKNFVIFFVFLFTIFSLSLTCSAADMGSYEDIAAHTASVSINKVWNIKFNMELNKSTVNSNNIMVLNEDQQPVPINVTCGSDNKSVTVAPLNSYSYGKTYSLIITKNVQALSGKTVGSTKRMKFNTESQANSAFKVCIDAGCGGSNAGQIGKAGVKESSINLSVALKVGKILQNKGIQVVYTRTSDDNVDMPTRFSIANSSNVNCFISIHCNASKSNPAATGIETYYLDGNSAGRAIASEVQAQLAENTGLADRGAKPGQYDEVKSTDAPGIKVYLGFISTASEEMVLSSDDFQNKCAEAIANSLGSIAENINNDSGNSEETPGEADDIITYANEFLGIPYSYGGTSPVTGFDCSGFVQYVYAHFGIKLSRDTYSQIKQGNPVYESQLMPGDLIFFGTNDDPSHVAIYIGNNLIIHSPRTGEAVKINSLQDMKDYLCARRVLN